MADMTPGQVFGPKGDTESPAPQPNNSTPHQEVVVPIFQETTPPEPNSPAPDTQSLDQEQPSQPPAEAPTMPAQNPPTVQQPEPVAAPLPQPEEPETPPSPYVLPPEETVASPITNEEISWTASEYIAHHKSPAWFIAFGITALLGTVAVFFLTERDIISTIVVILVAVVFGMYAARKPRVQQYALSGAGVTIGQRTYNFSDLKSFALIEEGPFTSIAFMPLKRFMPILSIYFDPKDEERIVAFLAQHLPMEQRGHDAVERFMRKIKF